MTEYNSAQDVDLHDFALYVAQLMEKQGIKLTTDTGNDDLMSFRFTGDIDEEGNITPAYALITTPQYRITVEHI